MILEAAVVAHRTDRVGFLVKDISKELAGENWLSTQTTAFALLAIAKYSGAAAGTGSMDFSYSWSRGQTENVSDDSPVYQLYLPPGDSGSGRIKLNNNGDTTVYARVIVEGVPRAGEEEPSENGVKLSVEYLDPESMTIDSDTFEQGTDFIAAISVKNPGDRGIYQEPPFRTWFPRDGKYTACGWTKQPWKGRHGLNTRISGMTGYTPILTWSPGKQRRSRCF